MPLVQTRGAASAQGFGEFAQQTAAVYVEDVFSTYLYTGTGSSQTITNNIDLSGKGGLTWIKGRSGATGHRFTDTARGATKSLASNSTAAEATESTGLTAFGSTGFTIGADADYNTNANTYVSWTFRKQAKFFDVVTFNADLSKTNQRISHNLGSVPGTIIIKCTNVGGSFSDWWTYHRSLGRSAYLTLNSTTASTSSTNFWGTSDPTSTDFGFNAFDYGLSGGTYVAYLFAHDAGGFGAAGTNNVISCGSYTGTGANGNNVTLGYEPQWLLIKRTNSIDPWLLFDNMRGMSYNDNKILYPDASQAEDSAGGWVSPTATGFVLNNTQSSLNGSGSTYIYIAIRRGPMKTPTSGTSVFAPVKKDFDGLVNSGFPTDLIFGTQLEGGNSWRWLDRLRGGNKTLSSNSTTGESTENYWKFDNNSGVVLNIGSTFSTWSWCNFLRAPGFFDTVCYTGTGSATTFSHNLGVVPEMMIVKNRSTAANWMVYHKGLNGGTSPQSYFINLNLTTEETNNTGTWNNTAPTSSVFSVGSAGNINNTSDTYVAYLFATVTGVSKVGFYTGTGTTQTINCGFTAGARFVLIKCADNAGDWFVWDTARGIVSGNDPYLLLNSTAAEVTNTDYVDTANSGFEISSTAPAAINANGGTFIFLAIA